MSVNIRLALPVTLMIARRLMTRYWLATQQPLMVCCISQLLLYQNRWATTSCRGRLVLQLAVTRDELFLTLTMLR
jgi:hypothetical protein